MKILKDNPNNAELLKKIADLEKQVQNNKCTEDVEDEGYKALMGEDIFILGANYFYRGTLVGVNTDTIKLKDASVVFETGAFTETKPKLSEKLSGELYINIEAVEAFCKSPWKS